MKLADGKDAVRDWINLCLSKAPKEVDGEKIPDGREYGCIIGRLVRGTIDRPAGTSHPRYPALVYPINYGYVDGIFAGDGAEQDVYLFGTEEPLEQFEGKVIAVWHRFDDVEDKWIVSLDGKDIADDEILRGIFFQERFFCGKLYRQRHRMGLPRDICEKSFPHPKNRDFS